MKEQKQFMNTMLRIILNRYLFFSFLSLFFIVGCRSREEKEVRRMIGRTIYLDGPLLFIDSCNQYATNPKKSDVRIITTLDYNECYDCSFKSLINFKLLLQKEKELYDNVEVLAVANKLDIKRAKEELRKWDLNMVVVLDTTNYYVKENKIGSLLYRNRTFINRVVLVGNPIISSQLRPYYLAVLRKLFENEGVIN